MRALFPALALTLLVVPSLRAQERTDVAPEGFISLFNGKDFSGWHGMPHYDPRELARPAKDEADREKLLAGWNEDMMKHWRVDQGELVSDGEGVFLTTDKDFGDIELRVDYKIGPKGDSGIYLRGTPQVQIWDFTPEAGYQKMGADKGSGGLWNNSPGAWGKDPLIRADKPIGQWNSFRIAQVGARTTVYLNDRLVVNHAIMENFWDRAAPLFPRGVIQLQTHGHETRWRNVYLRPIDAAEANAILAGQGGEGFQSVFDGTSLKGWSGAVDSYEVADGAIRCKPGKGGVLYYDKELTDFQARVEFRLPPGGNNGLAIRYPGQGDTAYHGMCELQVLDDTAEKYAKLDPRQYHGSIYGMVPSKRGYLRPVGEWNFQEVTVGGSRIKVELNGTVIVDADVSEVKEFMNNSPHPGKDRTSGFFGFAGHNDPVEFRSVAIKPL
jgi:hypothetical protein